MRLASAVLLGLLAAACQEPTRPAARYDHMLFERLGGGDLAFTVSPGLAGEVGHVRVTHLDFRAVDLAFDLVKTDSSAVAFESLADALAGRVPLTGSFRQDTLPTGTWAFVYLERPAARVEVTEPDLRQRLLRFESLVRAKL